jgi:hypothetical protein
VQCQLCWASGTRSCYRSHACIRRSEGTFPAEQRTACRSGKHSPLLVDESDDQRRRGSSSPKKTAASRKIAFTSRNSRFSRSRRRTAPTHSSSHREPPRHARSHARFHGGELRERRPGNYVSDNRLNLGNSVSVDEQPSAKPRRRCPVQAGSDQDRRQRGIGRHAGTSCSCVAHASPPQPASVTG